MIRTWTIDPAEIGNIMRSISDEITDLLPRNKHMITALIFEEVFVNIAKYAYEKQDISKPLEITCEIDENICTLTFADYGRPFNPISYVPSVPDGEQIGGHGIRIVKELASCMYYQRTKEGKNVLKIVI